MIKELDFWHLFDISICRLLIQICYIKSLAKIARTGVKEGQLYNGTGVSSLGVPWHPQILADQLTLSQLGGQIMPTWLLLTPPDFQPFRRPWMVDNRIVLSDIWQDPTGSSTFMLKSSAGQNWGPIFIRLTIVGVKILRWKKSLILP